MMGKGKKIFVNFRILIPSVGAVVLLIALTIFFSTKSNKDSLNTVNLPTGSMNQKFDTTPTTSNSLSEIKGWKTYNQNNITFKYPSDWILDEKNNRVFAPDNEGIILYVYNESNIGHIDDLKCKEFVDSKTINGLVLQKYMAVSAKNVSDKCWGVGMEDLITIFITKEGDGKNTYRAEYGYSKQQETKAKKTFDQIISTFKFVN